MYRAKDILNSCKKVVIKIGTNLLADKEKGINLERIKNIAQSVSGLQSNGKHVVIVSSGAIGAGVAALKLKQRPKTIPEKQAAAFNRLQSSVNDVGGQCVKQAGMHRRHT